MDQRLNFVAMMLLILPSIAPLGKKVFFYFCFNLIQSRHKVFGDGTRTRGSEGECIVNSTGKNTIENGAIK